VDVTSKGEEVDVMGRYNSDDRGLDGRGAAVMRRRAALEIEGDLEDKSSGDDDGAAEWIGEQEGDEMDDAGELDEGDDEGDDDEGDEVEPDEGEVGFEIAASAALLADRVRRGRALMAAAAEPTVERATDDGALDCAALWAELQRSATELVAELLALASGVSTALPAVAVVPTAAAVSAARAAAWTAVPCACPGSRLDRRLRALRAAQRCAAPRYEQQRAAASLLVAGKPVRCSRGSLRGRHHQLG
jgi:hypothetical protein